MCGGACDATRQETLALITCQEKGVLSKNARDQWFFECWGVCVENGVKNAVAVQG